MTIASSPTTDELGKRQRALSAVGCFRGGARAPRRHVDQGSEMWDEFRGIADALCDFDDRVLWRGRLEGRGRSSGVPINTPVDVLFDFRRGKISRIRSFLDHGEALRAAGLCE